MDYGNIIVGLAASLVIVLGVFILIRQVVLWYYRIDDRLKLLEEIRDELKKLNSK